MNLQNGIDDMRSLLEIYEEYRDDAQVSKDGFAFLYWSARCTECLAIMESLSSVENNPE